MRTGVHLFSNGFSGLVWVGAYVGDSAVGEGNQKVVGEEEPGFGVDEGFDKLVFLPFAALVGLLAGLGATVGWAALRGGEEFGIQWRVG